MSNRVRWPALEVSGTMHLPVASQPSGDPGLWEWDLVTNRMHFSPRWLALLGLHSDAVGHTPEEWLERVHPEDRAEVTRQIEIARITSSGFVVRHRLRHRDGTYRWMQSEGVVTGTPGDQVARLAGSMTEALPTGLADALTGLPNRHLLSARIAESITRAARNEGFQFAVLILHVERLLSDGVTVPEGDSLLATVARRLERCLRVGGSHSTWRDDDLVARLDGDHFAVLLDGLKEITHVTTVADRILTEVRAPFRIDGSELFVKATMGITLSVTGYSQAEDVLRDADTALHRARVLGGSHYEVFDTGLLKARLDAHLLEQDLSGAVRRDECYLLYQPIVALESNRVVGFEALVRWRHPTRGVISPVDFVPIAEASGQITSMGAWILRQACQQLRAWQEQVPGAADLWVSVNVSAVQLQSGELLDQIGTVLRDTSLDPSGLMLELTESMAMANPTATKALLMQLRALGVRISIDDFGTGYSSLSYLSQLPLDTLKVDRSFVRGIEVHDERMQIVSALTTMAQQLGLQVVAEGVETEEHLGILRSLGCDKAQGYLFAKPLSVVDATDLLTSGSVCPGLQPNVVPPSGAPLAVSGAAASVSPRSTEWMRFPRLVGAAVGLLALASAIWFARLPSSDEVGSRATVSGGAIPTESQQRVSTATGAGATLAAPRGARERAAAPGSMPPRPAPSSFSATHLHRFGSCRGQFTVSDRGVSFSPAEIGSQDGVELPYGAFNMTLSEDTLTVRTPAKTYRFRFPNAGNGNPPPLQEIANRVRRFDAGKRAQANGDAAAP